MAKQTIRVTLPTALLRVADKLAREGRQTRNDVVAAALTLYRKDLEILRDIQRAGQRAARAAGIRTMKDVDRLVHEVRAERRRARGS